MLPNKLIEPQVLVKELLYGKSSPKLTNEKGEDLDIDPSKLEELLRNYLLISTYRNDQANLNQTIRNIMELINNIPIITIDDFLSLTSLNPVQNKVITEAINELQLNKQDKLIAGDNIQILNNVISAIDTTYQSSDFDIKDLSDSEHLRDKWNNKQDELSVDDNLIHLSNNRLTVDSEIDDSIESSKYTWSSEKIQRLINSIDLNNFKIVNQLPVTDIDTNAIYLVPKQDAKSGNVKDEYIYVDNNWELIGSTEVDLSDYYNKTEVDEKLDLKQDKLTEGDFINIDEDNVISADLSNYYNKSQVDTKLNAKQNVITGSNGEVVYHNGNSVFTQTLMNEGYVCTNQEELDLCKNNSPSFKDVFNTWTRFSILNNTDNAKPGEVTAWTYNTTNDTIVQPLNTDSYVGFISPNSYSSYDITVRLYSNGDDNDAIGLVAAIAKDANGKLHTLSFVRSTSPLTYSQSAGNMGMSWFAIIDFNQFNPYLAGYGQKVIVNNSSTARQGINVKWNALSNGTVINMTRNGNVFTAKCSQFNSLTLDDNTLITIDLDTLGTEFPELESVINLFKGSSPWGYSNLSQPNSMYSNISVTDPNSTIYDLVHDDVLQFSSSTKTWSVVPGLTPIEAIKVGRFSYNKLTDKLFYNNGSGIINVASKNDAIKLIAGNNITIDGNVISATDTKYNASDFDIKDLSDSTNLKSTWNNKQDALTAGDNIQINSNVISATDTTYSAGDGIEIDENNKISLVQQDTVTETPVDTDDVNIFYNYNGVKVVVPEGKGYFNLLHDYIIPDAADGDQIFPKGLYIEDDATLAPDNVVEFNFNIFSGVKYSITLSTELLNAMTDAGYTESQTKNFIKNYFNAEFSENSVFAKAITSPFNDDLKLAMLPITTNLGTSRAITSLSHYKVDPEYQILRLNDHYIDIFGNVYKITDITSEDDDTYVSIADVVYKFNYNLVYETRTSIPIILNSKKSSYSDDPIRIIEQFIGSQIGTLNLVKSTSGGNKIPIRIYSSGRIGGGTYTGTFKSTYRNENDQLCYVYSYGNSNIDLAMTFRKVKLYKTGPFVKRLTFCGFVTIGSDYSVEIPIQYTTDTTELQGFSWTNKESTFDSSFSNTSINAVQNKVITGELAKLRTEFVPHYIELPSDGIKGDIIQYIGYTNNYFTNGYFYKYDNIIIPPNTKYISLNNDYPKFKRGVYTEIGSPANFPSLGIVQVIFNDFYGDYTIAEGQDEYGTLYNFPGNKFDFFGVPDRTDRVELMKGLDYIQVGELAADEAGNLYRISEVDTNSRYPNPIKVKLEVYRLAYDFTLKRDSEPDVTYKLSDVLSQILSETWISIRLDDGTSIQYSLFKTFANYRGDTIYAYKYSSGTSMDGPMYCCSTKLVNGVVRPTFAGFLYWSNWVQTIYIETGSLTIKPQIYTSGNTSVISDYLGWSQIDVQPNSGGGVIYTAGNNIQIENNVISATDTKYSASDFDIKDLSDSTDLRSTWSGKQDVLTAGSNITITGTEISATDTTYQASDFDIKDLSDSTNLKSTWNSKQDALSSGNGIEINNNTVSIKYDNETIVLDENGKLKSVASGGLSGDYLPQVNVDLADYECEVGTIAQYVGTDSDKYKNGYIYKRIAQGGYIDVISNGTPIHYVSEQANITDINLKSKVLSDQYFHSHGNKLKMQINYLWNIATPYHEDTYNGTFSVPKIDDMAVMNANYSSELVRIAKVTQVTQSGSVFNVYFNESGQERMYEYSNSDEYRIREFNVFYNSNNIGLFINNQYGYEYAPTEPEFDSVTTGYALIDEGGNYIPFTDEGGKVYKLAEQIEVDVIPWTRIDVQPHQEVPKIQLISQADFDTITKDPNTIYFIPVES